MSNKDKVKVNFVPILKEINSLQKLVASQVARDVRDNMMEMANFALISFYNDYEPQSYQRHYYNFLDNSYAPLYVKRSGISYRGGIYLTPENMDDLYHDSKEDVFISVYEGYHGISYISSGEYGSGTLKIPPMRPNPMTMLQTYQYDLWTHGQNLVDEALKKIPRKGFEYIRF